MGTLLLKRKEAVDEDEEQVVTAPLAVVQSAAKTEEQWVVPSLLRLPSKGTERQRVVPSLLLLPSRRAEEEWGAPGKLRLPSKTGEQRWVAPGKLRLPSKRSEERWAVPGQLVLPSRKTEEQGDRGMRRHPRQNHDQEGEAARPLLKGADLQQQVL